MKSILQEASTVLKAVEKAWISIGKPEEFSVKILDKGEKGLLGLTKKLAIVSLAYNPRSTTEKPSGKKEAARASIAKKKEMVALQAKKTQIKKTIETKKAEAIKPKRKQVLWIDEYVADIEVWLKEVFMAMNIKTPFQLQPSRKILNVNLDGIIFKSADEERSLFVSLSYLLMQFLKKKYKKKLDGYHLILNSKRPK